VPTRSSFGGVDEARIAPKAQSIPASFLSFGRSGAAGQTEWNKKTNTGAKDKTLMQNRILFPFSKGFENL